ncbi:hypothetical protein NIASO_09715 [Niabella soli DSM 19437]|uniref:Uncharacterized protein n=1 Tax=Niabella soli DSM 19437 TaxID=929713 RepID=W0F3E7_9BACT|nr:hypothetical protein NIASO_09715 [Niabella soli DSM 19437]
MSNPESFRDLFSKKQILPNYRKSDQAYTSPAGTENSALQA